MAGARNLLAIQPEADPNNLLTRGGPTWADAGSWHAQNLRDTWTAMQDPQTWRDAASQYGSALAMGSVAPSLRAAVRIGGKVYPAPESFPTHVGALQAVPSEAKAAAVQDVGDWNSRVFVNDRGQVLDRMRAARYAQDNDLLARGLPDYAYSHPELITEWLQSHRDWARESGQQPTTALERIRALAAGK